MLTSTSSRARCAAGLLVLLGLLAASCSRMPTAPTMSEETMKLAAGSLSDPQADKGRRIPPTDDLQEGALVDGSVGVTLHRGRVTVVFPPDAFHGKATVSLKVSSLSATDFELSISPAAKNPLVNPAQVTVDVSDLDTYHMAFLVWDAAWNKWRQNPSDVDNTTKTITAPVKVLAPSKLGRGQFDVHTD